MTRYQDPIGATNPVQSSSHLDSLGQLLLLQDPESAPRFFDYSDWGELLDEHWTDNTTLPSTDRQLLNQYDGLGRLTHREERNNDATDPETMNEYLYDVGVSAVHRCLRRMFWADWLGRHPQAKSTSVMTHWDASTRKFSPTQRRTTTLRKRHSAVTVRLRNSFYLPDTNFTEERVDYAYDSAARLRTIEFSDGSNSSHIYKAVDVDPLGRVRKAVFGGLTHYSANYADVGRRL